MLSGSSKPSRTRGNRSPGAPSLMHRVTEISRAQLYDWMRRDCLDVANAQPWARSLLAESGSINLLPILEERAYRAVVSAGAENALRLPRVSVKRLADSLGANVEVAPTDDSNPFPQGLLERKGPLSWRVRVTKPTYSTYRYSIAHELGHTFLYRTRDSLDTHAWETSTNSQLEEALANYLGRFLLAPDCLVLGRLRDQSNAAEAVFKVLMDEFGLPLRHAILRWIDLSEQFLGATTAGILWEQYHAFASERVLPNIEPLPEPPKKIILGQLARIRASLGINPETREVAEAIWQEVASHGQSDPAILLSSSMHPEIESLRETLRLLLTSDIGDQLRSAAHNISSTNPHLGLRPEWFAVRTWADRTFVPCKRGHARRESAVCEVGPNSTDRFAIANENVSIGTVTGSFRVHAGARGSWPSGTRRVVQLLLPNADNDPLPL